MTLTAERLREVLSYDPETGQFRWQASRRKGFAGTLSEKGYRRIRIDGGIYRAHRLAWLYMTGAWPPEQVDHINLNRDDNRWANLRAATNTENARNRPAGRTNTSGHKGVFWHKRNRRWVASITVDRQHLHLGNFRRVDDAVAAYARAVARHHGEFARAA